jgi:hypothetical protein
MSAGHVMRWRTHDGREISITEVEDTHLANIIYWVKDNKSYGDKTKAKLLAEAKRRKFMDEFLELAPYAYQNDKGEWIDPKTLKAKHEST